MTNADALKVKGVSQTVMIDTFTPPWGFQPLGGVAVIANNTWSAFQGRKKLNISWDDGRTPATIPQNSKKNCRRTARKPGKVVAKKGNVDNIFAAVQRQWKQKYYLPHLAHATMEPLVATAEF